MESTSWPNFEKSLELLEEIGSRENIIRHSILVMKVTRAICDNLKSGTSIDSGLACAGAILHDITKTRALETHEHHDVSGGIYMRTMGLPEIAEIIENHVFLKSFNPENNLNESEIVHYADKRVKHSEIVSIDERISDLIVRYGSDEEKKKNIADRIFFLRELENKIQSNMESPIDETLKGIK